MASKKDKDKDKKISEDLKTSEDIKPKQSTSEETDFIMSTMDHIEERKTAKEKEEKKEPEEKPEEKTEVKDEKEKEDKPLIVEIDELEHDIKKNIEFRKIVKHAKPMTGLKKTYELLGHGFHYFVELEEYITKDFFFGWLPSKIRKYLKLIIPFTIFFIFLSLNLNISNEIQSALALFLCISLLWALESINIVVTALLIPVLAVILGLIKNTNPFSSFSNPIIYLLLAGLIIAQAFRKHELDKMIAMRVLALSQGNVKKLLFFTMLITALLGMWMSNTATIALLVPMILKVSAEVNHRIEKNYTTMLLLSSGFAAAIGGVSTIIGSNPNAITAAFLRNEHVFTFFDWVKIGFPVSLILFVVAYFVFIHVYGVGNETIDISSIVSEAKKKKLNREQKKLLLIFFPTIFLWLFGGELTSFLHFPADFYRTEVIGLAAAILLFAFNILSWDDVRRIPWEIFLLVGGGLTLGQILIDTGSASFIAHRMFTLFSILPLFIVIFLVVVIAIVLANFVNNSSTTIILVPVLLNLSSLLNIDKTLLVMTAALATAIAPLTPIAMPSFSIIYGTDKVSRKEMVSTGFYIAVICAPILAGLIYLMNIL